MTDQHRQTTIDSWHMRADAYEVLVGQYQIFTDMVMGLLTYVKNHRTMEKEDLHVMDLAAGTGLVSKILIDRLHLPPTSLYLVEPAEQMCVRARETIKTPHIYQIAAEDCLSLADIPRDQFDFILCNASMHLMSESNIYPIVSKLLKPKSGHFLYTLWYHAFDETEHYNGDEGFESCVNDVLISFNYPKYYSLEDKNKPRTSRPARSRKYLEETAQANGLKLQSCTIRLHRTPMSFDLDFALMTPNWLLEHLKTYEWTQKEVNHSMKEQIVEKVRELIEGKFNDIPVVEVVVSRV
jgi:SAM-dependent methyltransferase